MEPVGLKLDELFEKKEKIFGNIEKKLIRFSKKARILKRGLERLGVIRKIHPEDIEEVPSFVCSDSAFGMKITVTGVIYSFVAVAIDRNDLLFEPKGEVFIEGLVEEVPEIYQTLLDSMALGTETMLLWEAFCRQQTKWAFLDGSLATFLIKLNAGFYEAEKRSSSKMAEVLRRNIHRYAQSFHALVRTKHLVAVPKTSSRKEFSEYLSSLVDNFPDGLVVEVLKEFSFLPDRTLLRAILLPGEYILVPGTKIAHTFHGSYKQKEELMSLLNQYKVIYLKDQTMKVVKLEILSSSFPISEFFPLFCHGQFMPLFLADQEAKKYFKILADRTHPLEEEYR